MLDVAFIFWLMGHYFDVALEGLEVGFLPVVSNYLLIMHLSGSYG